MNGKHVALRPDRRRHVVQHNKIEAYGRVRSGAKRIVVGNRGIGKSAIFQVLARREREEGSYVIELSPEDYSYELLSQTMAAENSGSWAKLGAYAVAWKYLAPLAVLQLLIVILIKGLVL